MIYKHMRLEQQNLSDISLKDWLIHGDCYNGSVTNLI